MRTLLVTVVAVALLGHGAALAQGTSQTSTQQTSTSQVGTQKPGTAAAPRPQPPATTPRPAASGATVPAEDGFIIGPEDVLGINFWRDQEMSGDVTVRPDGMITLPLLRDVKAAGLTPNQLADQIQEAAKEYLSDASVTVLVRQMNSRKAFITGEVARPGAYHLASSMTVMQLIAVAGGLTEFAQPKKISVIRIENGVTRTFKFEYLDVAQGKKPQQNIMLKPGDTVVVPER